MNPDWTNIETEYVTGNISLGDIVKKYKVSKYAACLHSKQNGWVKKREEYRTELKAKAIQKTQEKILSDVEKGAALLNEAWLNMCEYCARKSKEQLEPIDMQRIANMYQTLNPTDKGDNVYEAAGIVLLPKQEVVQDE